MKLKVSFLGLLIILMLIFSGCDLFDDDTTCECGGDCQCADCECTDCECKDSENTIKFIPTEFELEVFDLTNAERANHGLTALIWHDTLAYAARKHSEDLMLNDMTGHAGSNGSTVGERIESAGITNWRTWAENCAYGYTTPAAVVEGWMNSPRHRTNILKDNVTHLGVGYVPRPQGANAQYSTYWTQKFCAFR